MDPVKAKYLDEAIGSVSELDEFSVVNGISSHYVGLAREDGEVRINANAEGLVHIALSMLKLAKQGVGAHVHFDESGIVDKGEFQLIITKCEADWEA